MRIGGYWDDDERLNLPDTEYRIECSQIARAKAKKAKTKDEATLPAAQDCTTGEMEL